MFQDTIMVKINDGQPYQPYSILNRTSLFKQKAQFAKTALSIRNILANYFKFLTLRQTSAPLKSRISVVTPSPSHRKTVDCAIKSIGLGITPPQTLAGSVHLLLTHLNLWVAHFKPEHHDKRSYNPLNNSRLKELESNFTPIMKLVSHFSNQPINEKQRSVILSAIDQMQSTLQHHFGKQFNDKHLLTATGYLEMHPQEKTTEALSKALIFDKQMKERALSLTQQLDLLKTKVRLSAI